MAAERRGPIRLSDLAAFAGLNPTMLSRLIAKLEGAELIRRLADEADRRVCRVEATGKGRRLLERIRSERDDALSRLLVDLGPDERRSLVSMHKAALRPSAPARRAKGQLRAGFRYVAGEPRLGVPLVMMAIVGTLAYEFQVALPVVARQTFHGGAATYGFLTAAMGVGALGAQGRPAGRSRRPSRLGRRGGGALRLRSPRRRTGGRELPLFLVGEDPRDDDEVHALERLEGEPAASPGHDVDRQRGVLPVPELRPADAKGVLDAPTSPRYTSFARRPGWPDRAGTRRPRCGSTRPRRGRRGCRSRCGRPRPRS